MLHPSAKQIKIIKKSINEAKKQVSENTINSLRNTSIGKLSYHIKK